MWATFETSDERCVILTAAILVQSPKLNARQILKESNRRKMNPRQNNILLLIILTQKKKVFFLVLLLWWNFDFSQFELEFEYKTFGSFWNVTLIRKIFYNGKIQNVIFKHDIIFHNLNWPIFSVIQLKRSIKSVLYQLIPSRMRFIGCKSVFHSNYVFEHYFHYLSDRVEKNNKQRSTYLNA